MNTRLLRAARSAVVAVSLIVAATAPALAQTKALSPAKATQIALSDQPIAPERLGASQRMIKSMGLDKGAEVMLEVVFRRTSASITDTIKLQPADLQPGMTAAYDEMIATLKADAMRSFGPAMTRYFAVALSEEDQAAVAGFYETPAWQKAMADPKAVTMAERLALAATMPGEHPEMVRLKAAAMAMDPLVLGVLKRQEDRLNNNAGALFCRNLKARGLEDGECPDVMP